MFMAAKCRVLRLICQVLVSGRATDEVIPLREQDPFNNTVLQVDHLQVPHLTGSGLKVGMRCS